MTAEGLVANADAARLTCRAHSTEIPHVQIVSLRRGWRLRPQPSADRRSRADRRRRSGVHETLSGGDLLPGLSYRRVRHLRMFAIELFGEDRGGQLSLCRRAGLCVADVPPYVDVLPDRSHQAA